MGCLFVIIAVICACSGGWLPAIFFLILAAFTSNN